MKKIVSIILIACAVVCTVLAQQAPMDESKRLAIGVEMPKNLKFENSAQTLKNNIMQALVLNGLSAEGDRFTTLINVVELSVETTPTAPVQFITELEISLFIGDLYTGNVFGQTSFTVKGVDDTEGGSYISAIRNVKSRNPKLKTMILSAKDKILAYFDAEGDQIISRMDAYIAAGNYKAALMEGYSIPSACTDLYNRVTERLAVIPAAERGNIDTSPAAVLNYFYQGSRDARVAEFYK